MNESAKFWRLGIDTADCQWPLQLEAWRYVLSAATSHGGGVHQGARHCPLLRVRATIIQVCVNIRCSVEGGSINMVEFIDCRPAKCLSYLSSVTSPAWLQPQFVTVTYPHGVPCWR